MEKAVDLFAGPGGWDVAARNLGIETTGVEFDKVACQTRRAAGLETIEGDVRSYGPKDFPDATGLIASPPCQTFSMAGKGAGRQALDQVLLGIKTLGARQALDGTFEDERTALVLEPLRWALEAIDSGAPYTWLAFEQVPTVLPVWEAMAEVLRAEGYSVATGNVQAEQYGVPQTRKRAILVAKRRSGPIDWNADGCFCRAGGMGLRSTCRAHDVQVELPKPTHSKYYSRDPKRLDEGVLPWISMAEPLWGFGLTDRPSPTITGGGTETGGAEPIAKIARYNTLPTWGHQASAKWVVAAGVTGAGTPRPDSAPAPTITGKGTAYVLTDLDQYIGPKAAVEGSTEWMYERPPRQKTPGSVRVTPEQAAILQSFPNDYPWQGAKGKVFQQIGNAIPPLLAQAILSSLTERNV